MKSLLFGSFLSAAIKVASAGLTFLMFLFLARALGADEYGKFGTMFSLGTLAAMAALTGQHTMSIKVLSSLEGIDDQGATRRRFVTRSYLIIFFITAICILSMLLARIAASWFGFDLDMALILGASALILPFALGDLIAHQLRAFGHISAALVPRDVIWRACVILLCLVALAWPPMMPDALTAMLVVSGVLLVIVALQAGYFFRTNSQALVGTPKEDCKYPKQISIWMWIASLAMMGASLNIVVASPFLSHDQVGAYFAAHKTSQLLLLPMMAINVVGAPIFARLHDQNKTHELQDVTRKLAMILAIPLLLGAVILGTFAEYALALFDPAYSIAVPALLILTLSFLIFGFGGPTQQLMLMAGGERHYVRLTMISDLIGLSLVPLLVPHFGIAGAAMGLLTSRVLFTLMAVNWCRNHLQVDTSILSIARRASP